MPTPSLAVGDGSPYPIWSSPAASADLVNHTGMYY
jgi:hypothetical protein